MLNNKYTAFSNFTAIPIEDEDTIDSTYVPPIQSLNITYTYIWNQTKLGFSQCASESADHVCYRMWSVKGYADPTISSYLAGGKTLQEALSLFNN